MITIENNEVVLVLYLDYTLFMVHKDRVIDGLRDDSTIIAAYADVRDGENGDVSVRSVFGQTIMKHIVQNGMNDCNESCFHIHNSDT